MHSIHTLNVEELKKNLSELIKDITAGDEVILLKNNKPIAKISSFCPEEDCGKKTKEFDEWLNDESKEKSEDEFWFG